MQVLDEGDERAEGDHPLADLSRPIPQHQGNGDRTDRLDQGKERGLVDIGQVVSVAVLAVTLIELGEEFSLLGKELHHHNAREGLLQKRVDAGDALADDAIGLPRAHPEEVQGDQ